MSRFRRKLIARSPWIVLSGAIVLVGTVVKADRPFVWAIVERGSGVLLFAGIVRDPRSA